MAISSICIVGGGSGGWLMASALNKNFPNIKVTLVESPSVPTIGVGESAIPATSIFIKDVLGFEESEWMPYCDATFKAAIRFKDFHSKGKDFYHPFWTAEESNKLGFDWAVKRELTDKNIDVDDYYGCNYISYHMSEKNKFSRIEGERFLYSHHMDASKFAEFCKSKFNGTHVLSNVNSVDVHEGNITAVHTDKGKLEADLFIDCTGFKALLIGEALKEPFETMSETLLNDTAITCNIPYYDKANEMESCTNCTALSSGWAWNIPLWSRVGTGYAYSSKFLTEEEATIEFKEYLTIRFGYERVQSVKFNTIKFKTGKHKRVWVGNCLALPLAAGFIEPLESTGLAVICSQIQNFIKIIKDGNLSSLTRSIYNREANNYFSEIHNFVLLHYVNSQREDSPYWRYIKNDLEIPDDVIAYINNDSDSLDGWFPAKSKECILLGMKTPSRYSRGNQSWNNVLLSQYNKGQSEEILAQLRHLDDYKAVSNSRVNDMLSMYGYLKNEIYSPAI